MRRYLPVLFVSFVLLSGTGVTFPSAFGQQGDPAVRLPITLEADQRTELRARVEGYVGEVHVDIGDRVSQGELLVTLDAPELEAELKRRAQMLSQAEANIGVAQGQIATAQAKLKQARSGLAEQVALRKLRISERDRYVFLVEGGAVQREKLDEAQYAVLAVDAAAAKIEADVEAAAAAVDAAKNEFEFAKSGVEVARAEFEYAESNNQLRQIRAPFSGLVVDRSVDLGDLVSTGASSGKPLLVVEHVEVLRGVMTVPADEASRVHVGDPVTLIGLGKAGEVKAPDAGPLKVSRISQSLDMKTRTMRIEIDLKNDFDEASGRYQFLSGQYGSARIKTKL